MRIPGQALIAVLLATALVVAACGGDDGGADIGSPGGDTTTDDEPAPAVDDDEPASVVDADDELACGLLGADDVAATGYQVESGPEPEPGNSSAACEFGLLGSPGGELVVIVYTPQEALLLGPDLYEGTEALSGIALEAWYVPSLNLAQARLADDRVVSIQDIPGDAGRDGLVALLETAIADI